MLSKNLIIHDGHKYSSTFFSNSLITIFSSIWNRIQNIYLHVFISILQYLHSTWNHYKYLQFTYVFKPFGFLVQWFATKSFLFTISWTQSSITIHPFGNESSTYSFVTAFLWKSKHSKFIKKEMTNSFFFFFFAEFVMLLKN